MYKVVGVGIRSNCVQRIFRLLARLTEALLGRIDRNANRSMSSMTDGVSRDQTADPNPSNVIYVNQVDSMPCAYYRCDDE